MDHFAGAHFGNTLVDLIERNAMRDEILGVETSGSYHAEITRDVVSRLTRAAVRSAQDLAEMERKRVEREFPIMRHDAKNNATPRVAGEGKRFFEDLRLTGAVDDGVGGLALENSCDFGGKISLGGINGVRGAVVGGDLQFVPLNIDGDDRIGARELRSQNNAKANAAATDDDGGLADLDLGVVMDDAKASRERVGEKGASVEISVRRDDSGAILGNDGVIAKRGNPSSVDLLAIPIVDGRTGFDAAPGTPMEDDTVAGFDVFNLGTDFQDGGPGFVPKKVREIAVRALDPIDFTQLRSADAADMDLGQNLAVAENGNLNLVHDEGLSLFNQNGGGSLHVKK